MEILLKTEIGGRTLSIQTDKVAKQASGSVVVQYKDTIVLVTAVSGYDVRTADFLPLRSPATTSVAKSADPVKRKP
jgi:polyribonucleotide nucleotidyltransferase